MEIKVVLKAVVGDVRALEIRTGPQELRIKLLSFRYGTFTIKGVNDNFKETKSPHINSYPLKLSKNSRKFRMKSSESRNGG